MSWSGDVLRLRKGSGSLNNALNGNAGDVHGKKRRNRVPDGLGHRGRTMPGKGNQSGKV